MSWPVLVVGSGAIAVSIAPVSDGGARGISGLSEAGDGTLWAVAERARPRLLQLSEDGTVIDTAPVLGVPWGMDLESIDWLSDDLMVLGTEHPLRGTGAVLLAAWDGERAEVVRVWRAGRGGLDADIEINRGFEGICASQAHLAVASETRTPAGSGHVAAVYLVDRSTLDWHRPVVDAVLYLPLPERASVSGMHCSEDGMLSFIVRGRPDGVPYRGLMRHTPGEGEAELLVLPEALDPHNLEGLIATEDGFRAISDASEGEAVWVDLRIESSRTE